MDKNRFILNISIISMILEMLLFFSNIYINFYFVYPSILFFLVNLIFLVFIFSIAFHIITFRNALFLFFIFLIVYILYFVSIFLYSINISAYFYFFNVFFLVLLAFFSLMFSILIIYFSFVFVKKKPIISIVLMFILFVFLYYMFLSRKVLVGFGFSDEYALAYIAMRNLNLNIYNLSKPNVFVDILEHAKNIGVSYLANGSIVDHFDYPIGYILPLELAFKQGESLFYFSRYTSDTVEWLGFILSSLLLGYIVFTKNKFNMLSILIVSFPFFIMASTIYVILFFIVMLTYYLLDKIDNYVLLSLLFSFGILLQQLYWPFFILSIVFLYANGKKKIALYSFLLSSLIVLIASLPFLLYNYKSYISALLLPTSRMLPNPISMLAIVANHINSVFVLDIIFYTIVIISIVVLYKFKNKLLIPILLFFIFLFFYRVIYIHFIFYLGLMGFSFYNDYSFYKIEDKNAFRFILALIIFSTLLLLLLLIPTKISIYAINTTHNSTITKITYNIEFKNANGYWYVIEIVENQTFASIFGVLNSTILNKYKPLSTYLPYSTNKNIVLLNGSGHKEINVFVPYYKNAYYMLILSNSSYFYFSNATFTN